MNKQGRELEAIAGHFLDVYRLITFKFLYPHSYTKFRAIKSLKSQLNAKTFVETGTYLGVTTRRCAPVFEKVYTIELDEKLAQKANKFLARKKNVEVIQGDATEKLAYVFNHDVRDALVFLDGHFTGGDTACGDMPEPAIEELKLLSQFKKDIVAIIIDDFRLFGTEAGFPSKSSLFQSIEEYFPGFKVNVALDQILITRAK